MWACVVYTSTTVIRAPARGNERKIVNKYVKQGLAIALALAPIAAGADSCKSGPEPTGLILDISGPPLAQTLGCPTAQWYIRVVANDVANDPTLTPDQKAAKASTVCVPGEKAKKYTVNGQYP